MSSHVLDVSGARALTTRTNDPASTYASTPAKQGDDVQATLSGFRELRVALPGNARIQRRRYVRKDVVYENGKPKPNPVEVEYDELVLVLSGGTFFGRTSIGSEDRAGDAPTYEGHPHTNIVAKRWGDERHFLESGELIEEYAMSEIAEAFTVELDGDATA